MKKLQLKALNLGAKEILTREQLKSISGGCVQDSDCPGGICNSFKTCVGGSAWGGSGNPDPSDPSYFGDFPGTGHGECGGALPLWCEISQHCVAQPEECADY